MSGQGMRPTSYGSRPKHTHACAVPGCTARVPCAAIPVIDEIDDEGHVSGHMSCEDHGLVDDMLCDSHADEVPCVYCGTHGHTESCCDDADHARESRACL